MVEIDEIRFRELLALVGPASEDRLITSLIVDLRSARLALAGAMERREASVMRDQTHVLASLAGTFGAVELSAALSEFEERSHSEPGLPDGSRVLGKTERLIDLLTVRLGADAS